jgi:hypothetical protein
MLPLVIKENALGRHNPDFGFSFIIQVVAPSFNGGVLPGVAGGGIEGREAGHARMMKP